MPGAPEALRKLVGRYDPAVFEEGGARFRIRLAVAEGGAWDAVVYDGAARLEDPSEERPDALLTADAATWRRIATDLRGGMDAFRRRRLHVRHNLHAGVGFLAATSGAEEPGRLEFRRITGLSYLQAGAGTPVVMVHGLGGNKISMLADRRPPCPRIPRRRGRSARRRRLRQAARRALRRALLRGLGRGVPRRARDRTRARGRQQPRRAGGARARPSASRPRAPAGPARALAGVAARPAVGAAAAARAPPARPAADGRPPGRRRDPAPRHPPP